MIMDSKWAKDVVGLPRLKSSRAVQRSAADKVERFDRVTSGRCKNAVDQ
jgi:hypothetical protein